MAIKKALQTLKIEHFIGSNSSLVAPVTIGTGATIGAGSVISKDVAKDALALTRAEQREIKDWSKRKQSK